MNNRHNKKNENKKNENKKIVGRNNDFTPEQFDKKQARKNFERAVSGSDRVIPFWLMFILTLLADVALCMLAFWLADAIMYYRIDPSYGYGTNRWTIIMPVSVVTTIVMLLIFRCYGTVWKYAGKNDVQRFIAAFVFALVVIWAAKIVLYEFFVIPYWAPVILMYILFSFCLCGSWRFRYGIINTILYYNKTGKSNKPTLKRTIIIGAGYTGALIITRFMQNPAEGYLPVAALDDDKNKQHAKICGVPIVGPIENVAEVAEKYTAGAIVIAIISLNKSQLRHIYNLCKPLNIPIKFVPGYLDADEYSSGSLSIQDIKIENLLGRDEFKVRRELIDCSVKDKVVMVTGGAGSIGSELCRQVLTFGCKHLVIFDMHENGMFFLNQEFMQKFDRSRYTLVIGTVRERAKLEEVFEQYHPEIIFHAAAYKHVPMMEIAPTEAIKNNVFGTLNVIECAQKYGTDKMVLISTDKAVNPSNVMGASKRIAEMLVQTRGKTGSLKIAAVRFGNVLGSNGSVVPIFLDQIRKGGPVTLTDRNIKRYFMSIPEAVRLVLQTGAFASRGEVFVLDMGEPVYIYDLACDLIRLNGLVPEVDIPIEITGLRPGEKLFEELRYDKEKVDKTAHEGVFVNKLQEIDRKKFDEQLEKLRTLAMSEDEKATEEQIFTMVPSEYRRKIKNEQKG